MKILPYLAGALLLLAGSSAGAAEPLVPWKQTYELSRGMLTVGEAQFSLAQRDGSDCWRYEYKAAPAGMARLFIGDLSERSDFCIENGALRSQHFEYHRADKPKDDFSLEFDRSSHVVRISNGNIRQITDDVIDRLAMQIAVQRWVIARGGQPGAEELSITKMERKKLKTYRFRITAREDVKVPAGTFKAVRVERVDNPDKSVQFWLAPDRGYIPLRVMQSEDGDEEFKMELKG